MDSESVLPGDIVSVGTPQSLTTVSKDMIVIHSKILLEYH